MGFRIVSDDDGHNFVIPEDRESEWEDFLNKVAESTYGVVDIPDDPEWAKRVDGVSSVVFPEYKVQ